MGNDGCFDAEELTDIDGRELYEGEEAYSLDECLFSERSLDERTACADDKTITDAYGELIPRGEMYFLINGKPYARESVRACRVTIERDRNGDPCVV